MATKPFAHMPPPSLDDPHADDWTRQFWEATRAERLTAPRCTRCDRFRVPPSRFCPRCRSQTVEYVDLPGTGALFSFIVVRHALSPDVADFVPYMPAVIEADGCPDARFVSNLVDCEPEDTRIGMPVQVVWHHVSDTLTLPFWAPK